MSWNATQGRLMTSNHGWFQNQECLSVIRSLSYITEDLYQTLLILRPPGGINWLGRSICVGTGLFKLILQSRYWPFLRRPDSTYWTWTAGNFGLGGVLSQIQNDFEHVVAYCSHALRPSQRRYCTTKREMLATVSMCILFRSYLRGAKFILRTDHKSLV